MSVPDASTAALFVDFENVHNAIRERRGSGGADIIDLTVKVLVQLRDQLLRKHSLRLLLGRAYADWSWLGDAMSSLALLSVQPVYVLAKPGKNSADLEMSLDIQETLLTRPDVKEFVLVGGDRDYIPITRRLLEHDKRVVVAAFDSAMSGDLKIIVGVERFLPLDPFLPALPEAPVTPPSADVIDGSVLPVPPQPASVPFAPPPADTSEEEEVEAWPITIPTGYEPTEEDLTKALDIVIQATASAGRMEISLVNFFKSYLNSAFSILSNEQRKGLVQSLRNRGWIRLLMRHGPYGAIENYSGQYVSLMLNPKDPMVAARVSATPPDDSDVGPSTQAS